MARSATIKSIDRRGQRCTLLSYRSGGDKFQVAIQGGMGEFRDWIREQLKDSADTLVAIGLAQWLAKNPGSQDFSAIEGKKITLDLNAVANAGLVVIE